MSKPDERQYYDDSNAWDRPIQAFRFRTNGPKNETESARTLCHMLKWRFNREDCVTEDRGPVIGSTIEDVAAAMVDEGWIMRPLSGRGWVTNYVPMPRQASGELDSHEAAVRIRRRLNEASTYSGE